MFLTYSLTEKAQREFDNLTPLDARNSLLMDPIDYKDRKGQQTKGNSLTSYGGQTNYDVVRPYRDQTPPPNRWSSHESSENLVGSAASIDHHPQRSTSWEAEDMGLPAAVRQPTIPRV